MIMDLLPIITAIVGAVAGVVGTWLAVRRDAREARSQVLHEANTTIDLLKEQNDTLRTSLTAAEAREAEAAKREARLESRVAELEREYRHLVKSISTMGLCKDPMNCPVFKLQSHPE